MHSFTASSNNAPLTIDTLLNDENYRSFPNSEIVAILSNPEHLKREDLLSNERFLHFLSRARVSITLDPKSDDNDVKAILKRMLEQQAAILEEPYYLTYCASLMKGLIKLKQYSKQLPEGFRNFITQTELSTGVNIDAAQNFLRDLYNNTMMICYEAFDGSQNTNESAVRVMQFQINTLSKLSEVTNNIVDFVTRPSVDAAVKCQLNAEQLKSNVHFGRLSGSWKPYVGGLCSFLGAIGVCVVIGLMAAAVLTGWGAIGAVAGLCLLLYIGEKLRKSPSTLIPSQHAPTMNNTLSGIAKFASPRLFKPADSTSGAVVPLARESKSSADVSLVAGIPYPRS